MTKGDKNGILGIHIGFHKQTKIIKDEEDAHVKAQEYSIHSWPMCFGGRGVSDDGKMANHHFGSILGLLLFEYMSICEITLKVSLKSLDWQNGKMAKWANCFKQKSMGQILNQKRC